jgi:hypothetical protein
MHLLTTLALLLTMSSPVHPPSGQPGPMQPGDFTAAGPANVVSWQLKRLAPPSPLYIGRDDQLAVSMASNVAGTETVTVNYRLLRASDGVVIPGDFTLPSPGDRVVRAIQQPLAEGFLLSATCSAAVATARGQTFARLFLNRGAINSGLVGRTLMADYVTTRQSPGYPEGRIVAPSEGPGHLSETTFAAPSPGIELGFDVPTNALWRVHSIAINLATSGAAGTRVPTMILIVGGQTVMQFPSAGGIAPSSAVNVTFAPVSAYVAAGGVALVVPMPPNMVWSQSTHFATATFGLDVGDQWGIAKLAFEEWIDNA